MAVQRIGTESDDILEAPDTEIAGSTFDGKGGQDTLQLVGTITAGKALRFNFTDAIALTGFETIRGTVTTDYIRVSSEQLQGIARFESGGDNYWDYIEVVGSSVDLRNKDISSSSFRGIDILTGGATVTVNSKAMAMLLDGSAASNDHLVLEGILLTSEEKRTLHDRGFEKITDQSGVPSVVSAPKLSGIVGDQVTVSVGQTVDLDIGRNATVEEDWRIKTLSIHLTSPLFVDDKLDIAPGSGFVFVPGTFWETVYFNEVEIGRLRRTDKFNMLDFEFNSSVTNEHVQNLIRHLTYQYNGSTHPEDSNSVDVEVTDTVGQRAKGSFVIRYNNPPPEEPNVPDLPPTNPPVSEPKDGEPKDVEQGIFMKGSGRRDVLTGTDSHDVLKGLLGNDSLNGFGGNDTLYGGGGRDRLKGGGGKDAFVFDSRPKKTNVDRILDFSTRDDEIWLENAIFKKLGKKKGALKKSYFFKGSEAHDKNDYIVYDKKSGRLYYDKDGSGDADAVQIALVGKKLALTHKDLIVV